MGTFGLWFTWPVFSRTRSLNTYSLKISDVVGSGSGYKGEVADGGLKTIFWGTIYEAIVRADTQSKGGKILKGEGRAVSRTLSRKGWKSAQWGYL